MMQKQSNSERVENEEFCSASYIISLLAAAGVKIRERG